MLSIPAIWTNPDQQALIGKTVQQIADERGCPGVEAALDLLLKNSVWAVRQGRVQQSFPGRAVRN